MGAPVAEFKCQRCGSKSRRVPSFDHFSTVKQGARKLRLGPYCVICRETLRGGEIPSREVSDRFRLELILAECRALLEDREIAPRIRSIREYGASTTGDARLENIQNLIGEIGP